MYEFDWDNNPTEFLVEDSHMSETVVLPVEIGAASPKCGTVADYHERQISVPDLNA